MFSNTTFNQILKYIPKQGLAAVIAQHGSDRYAKTYSTTDHLYVMLASQFSCCRSLRDLEIYLNSNKACFYHLGLASVKRSTISDANQRIDASVFKDLCLMMLGRMSGKKQEIKNLVTA